MFFKITHNSDLHKQQINKYINEISKNNETTILNYDSKKESFTDVIISRNCILISNKLKTIFEKYKKNIINNRVVWIDSEAQTQEIYWTLNLEILECVSDKSIVQADSSIKKLVLDKEKIKHECMLLVCMVKDSKSIYAEKSVIFNLAVCESLLRRKIVGLDYELIEEE
ncbi:MULTISPECIES: hypothetical protein [unclassified Clostridium]|uniref:hypothetical protein n=1 Tax=unclassified Clostridium TaxID=2614128 RepID=UPI0002981F58|nr:MULTISPECIES: hypothetical protein [unclassified Clostridium]EKQ51447.1 MAG: hypothetical protein A370_04887 [Clostridium sp. Maddingley MBC34-26]